MEANVAVDGAHGANGTNGTNGAYAAFRGAKGDTVPTRGVNRIQYWGHSKEKVSQPWQKITGFDGTEGSWEIERFQKGLSKLFDVVERMMREEMAARGAVCRGPLM